jgi:tRNA modification GTPase
MLDLTAQDTIAAIATATGGGPRGVIRISGAEVVSCLKNVVADVEELTAIADSRRARSFQTRIRLDDRHWVNAQVLLWPTAAAFTRQPSAEIHTIGSVPILEKILKALCASGVRLAGPGEFTLRAFLGGRIDLTQAEGVLATIDAATQSQFRVAVEQLAGGLAHPLDRLRNSLLNLVADIEAGLDFVDEDISFVERATVLTVIKEALVELRRLKAQIQDRSEARIYPRVVLVGEPNAGKSSLFNLLAQRQLAIVSPIAGTTRDYLSAVISHAGKSFELIDTAGREPLEHQLTTDDSIETDMQRFAKQQQDQADLVIVCLDSSARGEENVTGQTYLSSPGNAIFVATKSDLPNARDMPSPWMPVSAVDGSGVELLLGKVIEFLDRANHNSSVLQSTNLRCFESANAAEESLVAAFNSASTMTGDEIVATDLRVALDAIGQIVGTVHNEEILDRLFSRFCIGK